MTRKQRVEIFMSQFDTSDFEEFVYDSVVPGVCLDCGYEEYSCEPDARANYCEDCGKQSVKSALVLLGVI